MKLTIEERADGIERIILAGRLDNSGAEQIKTHFSEITAARPALIVVDLAEVPFLSSIGIRLLLVNAKALKQQGGRMVIARPQPMVQEVLEIVGMNSMIPVHTDLDSACAAIRMPV